MPDWTVTDVILDDDGAYQITAHPDSPPVYCNKCDRQSSLTPIETKKLKYIDAPVHGRSCFILATRTRYKCAACGGEFWEGLAGVDTRRFKTERCVRYIQRESLLKPNTHVAEEVGVSETVVRLIAKPHTDYLNERHKKELRAPRFLGMDETKLAGSMRAIFIDLEDGWPIELLANHKDLTIKNFLMNLPGRHDVEVVTMDMCERYRDIVNAVMPQAAVVVDRWHVVRTAVEAMRKARIGYQKTLESDERQELQRCLWLFQKRWRRLTDQQRLDLDGWLKNHPKLREPYRIKEEFLNIWDNKDRASAQVALEAWRRSIPDDQKKAFKQTLSISIKWEKEILNFFDHNRLSSGKTENRNKQLKTIERSGTNYKFDKIRNRALFGKRSARRKDEYHRKMREWRAANPVCITCHKPFDEAAEEAVAKAARHPLTPRPLSIGYKECHACIQKEDDWWDFGWRADAAEMEIRYRAMRDAEQAEAAASAAVTTDVPIGLGAETQ